MMRPVVIHLVMAARPNIMKMAPLYHALKKEQWARPILVHTGQHYDDAMSDAFMRDFIMPAPDHYLAIGSGTHAEQTGRTMIAYESLCMRKRPDLCVVPGDVNATLACALTARKMNIPLAHLEAGLRSGDRTMPEEINRIAVDAIADFHWTPSPDATAHLRREGIAPEKIREVGNIMIDAYHQMRRKIESNKTRAQFGLNEKGYALLTLHRPSNVDDASRLHHILQIMEALGAHIPIVFPMHPRTRARLEQFGYMRLLEQSDVIRIIEPQSYIPFMNLVSGARCVITDSGGVQEETSYLGIPCLTLRGNTERPVTITHGTNRLVTPDNLYDIAQDVLKKPMPSPAQIAGWDGAAAPRIVAHIKEILSAADATQKDNAGIAA